VVTTLQLNGASTPVGALDAIDIGGAVPAKFSSASISGLLSRQPVSCSIFGFAGAFLRDVHSGKSDFGFQSDHRWSFVDQSGINPTAIAYNFQSSTILTVNALTIPSRLWIRKRSGPGRRSELGAIRAFDGDPHADEPGGHRGSGEQPCIAVPGSEVRTRIAVEPRFMIAGDKARRL